MLDQVHEIGAEGIRLDIPREVLDDLGWEAGQRVRIHTGENQITITPLRSAVETICTRALTYLDRRVGDATTIRPPVLIEGTWRVPVVLSYEDRELGTLVFTESGELLREASTTPDEMRRAAEAV